MSASAANPINYQDVQQQVTATDARAAAIPQQADPQQLDYINQILPAVLAESARTGIPPEVFIVQSGVETGWGTSGWWRNQKNPAGIGVTGAAGAGQGYPTVAAAFDDYANKLLGNGEAGQEQFASDVAAHASTVTLLQDLEQAPWAAGHYGGHGLEATYAALYGSAGNNATTGNGQAVLDSETSGSDSSGDGSGGGSTIQAFLNGLPLYGGLFKTASTATALEGQFLGLFANWRYVLEVFAGIVMMGLGVLLILHDTGVDKKAMQGAQTAAVVAAA
jgi:Mannosyl-glycoprotein endo-beta-N-acetylglucosaminidase